MYPTELGRWPRWRQRYGPAAGCWSRTPIPLCSHWHAWTTAGPAQRRANRLRVAVRELLARRGADLRHGRTLPRALREAGLIDVAAAGYFPVGGLACDRLEAATIRHVPGDLIAGGLTDDAEIDAHIVAINAGKLDLTLAPLISAWGRRPAKHPPALG